MKIKGIEVKDDAISRIEAVKSLMDWDEEPKDGDIAYTLSKLPPVKQEKNDTKYYVIMDGEYSDMRVVGITTDLELAEAVCKVSNAEYGYEYYWIYNTDGTEFITDTSFIQRASKIVTKFVYDIEASCFLRGAKMWCICGKRSIEEETTDTTTRFYVDKNNSFKARLHVYADKEEIADKIAYDFLAKKNAEENGL